MLGVNPCTLGFATLFLVICLGENTAIAEPLDPYDALGTKLERAYGVPPNALASDSPQITNTDQNDDLKQVQIDTGDAAQTQVPVRRLSTYMVQFAPDADLDEIQQVLDAHGLRVADEPQKNEQLSQIGTLIVEPIVPEIATDTGTEIGEIGEVFVDPLIQRLRADPLVRSAVPDLVISTQKIPRPPNDQPTGPDLWDWSVRDACVPAFAHPASAGVRDGNWGLKAARFPTAWRLVANRLAIESRDPEIKVAVLDAGFETNADLDFDLFPRVEHRPHSHGTHVAGIIGATFDNGRGIDGASPWARILAVPHARQQVDHVEGNIEEKVIGLQSDIMATLIMLLQEPDVRVVNVSLGYNWKKFLNIDPGGQGFASLRNDISNTGIMVQSVLGLAAARGILFVSAAGNDSGLDQPVALDVNAQWASPLNWAALNRNERFPVDNAIVVEAIDRSGTRAPFSNRGGHVSAPGTGIQSTVGGGIKVDDGTSMAAPHVTALATLLIAYDPAITHVEIARAIRTGARPAEGGAAPRIDALNTLVAHDPNALRFLADLDADGQVGPADVALFKEQWRKLQGLMPGGNAVAEADEPLVEAVTSANIATEDLNGDGVADRNEASWPLIDLNGSGVATDDACDAVVIGGKRLADYDVLGATWTNQTIPFDSIDAELCPDCPQQ